MKLKPAPKYVCLVVICIIGLVTAQSYNDQSTTLYVTDPSCANYKCQVIKHHGDQLYINWLNAPPGDVKLVLASESNQKDYTIKDRIAGTQTNCNHGDNGKRPCGQYTTVIPSDWKYGKYSVQVISLSTSDVGYTDTVTIEK